jgi:CYTH domain-containing protein/predicted ATPase
MIVIGGGDCAGKTTALSRIRDFFTQLGYTVFICPEAATELIESGITPGGTVSNELFQELVFKKILSNEAKCQKEARKLGKHAKVIIFCDRGLMDGMAFIDREYMLKLCKKFHGSITIFRDKRYLAIMHLRTAALGAEKFYTYDNNPARIERTLEEVRALDQRTLHAWVGQPHLRVIPNKQGETFDMKIDHLIEEICCVLGEPIPLEIERKYLVEIPDWDDLPLSFPHFERIVIVQNYLVKNKDGEKRRIRARGQNGSWFYTETIKRKITDITRIERERIISKSEYERLLATARDPSRMTIRKYRHCFVWKHQYFELDVFEKPVLTHALLEIELTREAQKVCLPPFLKILREVSDDPLWSNSTLARRIAV